MPNLEEYLEKYETIRSQLNDLELYIRQSANLLHDSCQVNKRRARWPYSFPYVGSFPPRVSVSTQAMCAAAVDQLLESQICDQQKLAGLGDRQARVLDTIFAQIAKDHANRKLGYGWRSGTFGNEDVFTASWLIEVLARRTVPAKVAKITVGVIREAMQHAVAEQFEKTLFQLPNDAGPHPLPLLRVLRALDRIGDSKSLKNAAGSNGQLLSRANLSSAAHWFERNLHRQMSFYQSSDFRFDAAEIVFCLAGLMQTGGTTSYDSLVKQVLEIIRAAQKKSVYWRPYRPMISTETGLALLPLSIEVATTLLDVLNKTGNFCDYQDTLKEYYKWLVSQRITENHQQAEQSTAWAGWHSENAYDWTKVHVSDTARVAMFMLEYVRAIKKQVQEDLREKSGFTIKRSEEITLNLKALVAYDEGARDGTQRTRIDRAIVGDSFSILLYGPPGTSKTTIAEMIAHAKGWDMVYITPSDFISGGESAIEKKTKLIFDTLTKMSGVLIFFDEIDRLLLDRDSNEYGRQGDIFQFMTPSMLAKLSELRKSRNVGFIIATNYAYRIDRAIKREGRIDKALLCIPPNRRARMTLIKRFLDEKIDGLVWTKTETRKLDVVAKRTVGYGYEQLRSFVKATVSIAAPWDAKTLVANLDSAPHKGAETTISSYDKRLDCANYPQKPMEELLALCILEAEVHIQTEDGLVKKLKELSKGQSVAIEGILSLAKACGLKKVATALEQSSQSHV